jgi:hypothetical protein
MNTPLSYHQMTRYRLSDRPYSHPWYSCLSLTSHQRLIATESPSNLRARTAPVLSVNMTADCEPQILFKSRVQFISSFLMQIWRILTHLRYSQCVIFMTGIGLFYRTEQQCAYDGAEASQWEIKRRIFFLITVSRDYGWINHVNEGAKAPALG